MDPSDDSANKNGDKPNNFSASGIKPNFLKNKNNNEDRDSARDDLASREAGSSNGVMDGTDTSNIEKVEKSGGIKNSVVGRSNKNKGKGKGKGKVFFKSKGALGLIIGLIFGCGGLMIGSQAMMPFSLVAQFSDVYDSMKISSSLRTRKFFNWQMDERNVKNPKKTKLFGPDTFKISKKQQSKLAARGIEYDDDFEGTGVRVLKYNVDGDNPKIIVADSRATSKLGDVGGAEVMDFDTIYKTDADFRTSYDSGSLTWRGTIGAWFDSVTSKFLNKIGINRNRFADFDNKLKNEYDGDGIKAVRGEIGKMDEEADLGGTNTKKRDEDGNPTKNGESADVDEADSTEDSNGKVKTGAGADPADIKNKINAAVGRISAGAGLICGLTAVVGSISIAITAYEVLQTVQLFTGYMEGFQKAQVGGSDENGKDVPIHELAQTLTTGADTTEYDEDGNITVVKKNVTPMQSEGIASLYSRKKANQNDSSLKTFNFQSSLDTIAGSLTLTMTSFTVCTVAKAAVSAASLIANALTFGMASIGEAIWGVLKSIGLSLIIQTAVSIITPIAVKIFSRDFSNIVGEDLGNAIVSGGSNTYGTNHRNGGGSLATREAYIAYRIDQQAVLAEEAKSQRAALSPFDISSQYTFFGSIYNKLVSFYTMSNGVSTISNISNIVSDSVVSLLPTATAVDVTENLMDEDEFEKTCPFLASIGAVGDAYCNPYIITDASTMDTQPAEVINNIEDQFDSDDDADNVHIDESSDLAKYIVYCDERESQFGIADQNIVNSLSVSTGSTILDSAIGAIPFVGDAVDIFESGKQLVNSGYISGKSCVAGNDGEGTGASTPNWDKAKYYQRFIEDQRLAENMGLIEQSAVSVFLDDYYEKNPLDNSYEGVLARYSGMTKDQVVALLDELDYLTEVADYDASSRYYFGEVEESADAELKFEEDDANMGMAYIAPEVIIYNDIRYRNFAV